VPCYVEYSSVSLYAQLEWLFDTGSTVHVTPYKYLLFNTSICYREIKGANGRHVQKNLVGDLLLKSEGGNYLYLQGVLYCFTRTL
jgi:hypothetical protein